MICRGGELLLELLVLELLLVLYLWLFMDMWRAVESPASPAPIMTMSFGIVFGFMFMFMFAFVFTFLLEDCLAFVVAFWMGLLPDTLKSVGPSKNTPPDKSDDDDDDDDDAFKLDRR